MIYSRKLLNEAKAAKIDVKVKAMADLMAMGWKAQDAFLAVDLAKISLSDDYNKSQMEKIITDNAFTEYFNKVQKQVARRTKANDEETEEADEDLEKILSKEEVASELMKLLKTMPKNDPKRSDILIKFSDLMQYKKEEVVQEDDTVHFYLPIWCKECSLYNKAKEEATKK